MMSLKLILFVSFIHYQPTFVNLAFLLKLVQLLCQAVDFVFINDEQILLQFLNAFRHYFLLFEH